MKHNLVALLVLSFAAFSIAAPVTAPEANADAGKCFYFS